MSEAFVDMDILLRLLTGDDPVKEAATSSLMARVSAGDLTLRAPATVIADAVFVLGSRVNYGLPRDRVRELLVSLLSLPRFQVESRALLIRALDIYATTNVDFGDAMIVAMMRAEGAQSLYSYDHDFDKFGDISRLEP